MAGLRGTALGSEPALRFVSLPGELEEKKEKDTAREFACEGFLHSEPEGLDGVRERERKNSERVKGPESKQRRRNRHTETEPATPRADGMMERYRTSRKGVRPARSDPELTAASNPIFLH